VLPVTEMQSALYNFQMANANKLASRCLSQKNKRARGSKREGGRGGGGGGCHRCLKITMKGSERNR